MLYVRGLKIGLKTGLEIGLKIRLDVGVDVEEPCRYHAALAEGHHSTRPRRQSSA